MKVTQVEHVHEGVIKAVSYIRDSDCFITCSADPTRSVVCRDVHGAKKAYTFQQNKVRLRIKYRVMVMHGW